jgi:hypothetical protein
LFAFLSVCPIHFHRLDLIVKLICCCFVFLHSSLLLTVYGQRGKEKSPRQDEVEINCGCPMLPMGWSGISKSRVTILIFLQIFKYFFSC